MWKSSLGRSNFQRLLPDFDCNTKGGTKIAIKLAMGTVASSFPGDDGTILADIIQPADDEWLTKHSQECKIPEADVLALWTQFQELGCNQYGILPKEAIANANAMAVKIFKEFPCNAEGEVTFQTFCNASKWYSDADIESRVRAAFQTLNSGQPIDQTILNEILQEVYKDSSNEVIERLVTVFMKQVDDKDQGFIDEDQFVNWVKSMPQDIVQAIMDFNPIGTEKDGEKDSIEDDTVTHGQLLLVAKEASQQDWALFANKLGFTLDDIEQVAKKFPDKPEDQLYAMLHDWKQKEKKSATVSALKDILIETEMKDVVDKL